VLANPLIKPDTRAIVQARDVYESFLAIRKDSTLFRMRTAQDVIERLKFHNVGPDQVPGLVVMSLDGASPRPYQGAGYARVVVLFNVDKVAKRFAMPELKGKALALHGIQQRGSDEVVKTSTYDQASGSFSVPARTVAVFVQQ
jgi:pullulanase